MGFLRKYIFPILFGVIFFSLFKNHLPKFKEALQNPHL